MEDNAVIETLTRQRLQPLDVVRGEVGPEPDRHRAVLELHDQGVLRIALLRQNGGGERDESRGKNGGKSGESHVGSFVKGRGLSGQRARRAATTGGTMGAASPPIAAI